jgi:plasmid stabilization system protein ParE
MPKLIFLPDGGQEVKASYRWYEAKAKGLGEDFLIELEHFFELIREQPNIWPLFSTQTRRFLLSQFPFSIIYVPSDEATTVLAVMHNRKRPGYWEDWA